MTTRPCLFLRTRAHWTETDVLAFTAVCDETVRPAVIVVFTCILGVLLISAIQREGRSPFFHACLHAPPESVVARVGCQGLGPLRRTL